MICHFEWSCGSDTPADFRIRPEKTFYSLLFYEKEEKGEKDRRFRRFIENFEKLAETKRWNDHHDHHTARYLDSEIVLHPSSPRQGNGTICDSENSCQILRIPDSLATKPVATFSFEKAPFWLTKAFWWAFLIPGFLSVVIKKAITPPNWDDHIRMRYHAWSGHELLAHVLFHHGCIAGTCLLVSPWGDSPWFPKRGRSFQALLEIFGKWWVPNEMSILV